MFSFLSSKKKVPVRSLDEIKAICKIVFIDDRSFPIIDILKTNGWRNIQRLKDVDALDQQEIREAHILFVDIQGVGKKLKLQDEGLGLLIALKTKYPNKKIIAYSAEDQGQVKAFHQGLDIADSRMSKNASSYEFEFKIEKFSKEIFTLEECVKRISELLSKELGSSPSTNEIVDKLNKIYHKSDYSLESISKIFNIQNASNIATIIELFMKG